MSVGFSAARVRTSAGTSRVRFTRCTRARPAFASASFGVSLSNVSYAAIAPSRSPAPTAVSAASYRGSGSGSASWAGPAGPTGSVRPVIPLATATVSNWSTYWRASASTTAPWKSGTTWPRSTAITSGTVWTPTAWASWGFASMSIRVSRNLPPYSVESLISTGLSASDASERGDQNSTITGTWIDRSITSAWKVGSVTFSTYGPPLAGPPGPPPGAPGPPGAPEPLGAPGPLGPPGRGVGGLRRDDRSIAPGREKFGWLTAVLAFRAHYERSWV